MPTIRLERFKQAVGEFTGLRQPVAAWLPQPAATGLKPIQFLKFAECLRTDSFETSDSQTLGQRFS
ncbi:MAG: hypothetical protein JNL67_19200 [Planctomycetaceae bacterium]|nr:hypothetical protein [Planctomycetaceae bacterium]